MAIFVLAMQSSLHDRIAPGSWTVLRERIKAAGEVTPEIAVDAYAMTFGPVPGVLVPEVDLPRGFDASTPVRYVLRHWDRLEANQRAAIEDVLFGRISTVRATLPSVNMAYAGSPTNAFETGCRGGPTASTCVQEKLDELVDELAVLTGHRLQLTVNFTDAWIASENADFFDEDVWAWMIPAKRVGNRWVDVSPGEDFECVIALSYEGYQLSDEGLESSLVHELFHCYQADIAGLAGYLLMDDWLAEGSSRWAGEAFTGGSETGELSWNEYLDASISLFDREYDAMGFFAHLTDVGRNPWRETIAMFASGSNEAAYRHVIDGPRGTEFLDTWPASLARRPDWGPAWDAHGPGITSEQREPQTQDVLPGGPAISVPVPIGEQELIKTTSEGDFLSIKVDGFGALAWPSIGRETARFGGRYEAAFCVRGTCECPDGMVPPGVQAAPGSEAMVALTGATTEAVLTVDAPTLDELCARAQATPAGPLMGRTSACPHITTFDGASFDFYSIGEFVLLESPSGGETIHVRQQVDTHSDLVVNNTATAMDVGGTRVAITAGDTTPLSINGRPLILNSRLALEGGGSVEPTEDGVVVRWPSGLAATVAITRLSGSYDPYLDVSVALPDALRGEVRGLLGNANGEVGDDLMTRTGESLVAPIDLDDLVDVYGASWRITQAESLFDYPTGMTTEDFTDREYRLDPSAQRIPEAARVQAEDVCRNAGVSDAAGLEICVYHVALTGNPSYAESAAAMPRRPVVEIPIGGWRVIDPSDDVSKSDVAFSPRGHPVLAYQAPDGLRLIVCGDPSCVAITRALVPDSGEARDVELRVSDRGLPASAWTDDAGVHLASCLTETCSAIATARFDGENVYGLIPRPDGTWTVAFDGYLGLTLGWCGGDDCAGVVTAPLGRTLLSFDVAVSATPGENPVVVFEGVDPGGLHLVECLDPECDARTPGTLIEAGAHFDILDVTVSEQGTAAVLYVVGDVVRVARCGSDGCRSRDLDVRLDELSYDSSHVAYAGDRLIMLSPFESALLACTDADCGEVSRLTFEGIDSFTALAAGRDGRIVVSSARVACDEGDVAPCGLSLLDVGKLP